MARRFLLDTSFLINGWHAHYRIDVFEAIWTRLDDLMRDGTVMSCEEVLKELKPKDDTLYAWAREHRQSFERPNTKIIAELTKVMASFPNFAAIGGSLNRADPWVIAHARNMAATVVTYETPIKAGQNQKTTKPPKIPDVCNSLGVDWMRPIDFLAAIQPDIK